MPAFDDVNARVSFLLRDLAAVQTSRQKTFGYKRAAAAIFRLETPLTGLWRKGELTERIPGVGPSTSRIIGEVFESGRSQTVERLVDASGRRVDVERRRTLRSHVLSRSAVLDVLRRSTTLQLADYHGDFQWHSEWSDGASSLREMADACKARGYTYSAVTDHSHGLPIAGGMSMAEAAQQSAAIDKLNKSMRGSFRLLKGIEANISASGDLDLSPEEARQFEIVLAAPHSKLRIKDDQTPRMLAAIDRPDVRILAHPRGRMAGSRAGVVADWDRVFERAARRGVAIEIDGDPARQDLDWELAGRARDAGCIFALDSDAHSPDQLAYSETAVAHAILAGLDASRIVNYWDLDKVLAWLRDRKTARAGRRD